MVSHSVPFWGKTLDQDQDYLVTQLDDLSPFYCDLGIDQKRCQRYEWLSHSVFKLDQHLIPSCKQI